AGFGSAFGPVVLLSLYWSRMNQWGALAGMVAGAATVLFWVYSPLHIGDKQLNDFIYAMIPGFLISGLAAIITSRLTAEPETQVRQLFVQVQNKVKTDS